MKKQLTRPLLLVGFLILLTAAAMAYTSGPKPIGPDPAISVNEVVSLNGRLVQDKIYAGGDRTVSMVLTMTAADILPTDDSRARNVDLVVILDRSGSMEGDKIHFAREAIFRIVDRLSPKDRIALVSYSDYVQRHTGLIPVTEGNRHLIENEIESLEAGGPTNLGGGLREGMDIMGQTQSTGNLGRLILISDGLANKGITDTGSLGRMAGAAMKGEFAVSSVGVGHDFNEYIMTTIADHGGGNYYFLENPKAFANVFQKELNDTITAVASSLEIRIPLKSGWTLLNAAGFPVRIEKGHAVFNPGSLRSGRTRDLFLTLKVPTDDRETHSLQGINLAYIHNGQPYEVRLDQTFQVAVVPDPEKATASIDKEEWEKKVLQEDYNRLLEEVAGDIKGGLEDEAMNRIDQYYNSNSSMNSNVGSAAVRQNLENDLDDLRGVVSESFKGSAHERQEKQKANSKAIQFEGYRKRRAKQLQ